MENKNNLVNYVLILTGILFIILLAIFVISRRLSQPPQSKKTDSSDYRLSPSPYPFNPKNNNLFSPSPAPTTLSLIPTIPSSQFTGVKEEEFDPIIAAQVNQRFELRKQLPLKRGNLKIDFDYEKDVFVISPINEKVIISDEEREEFLNWLKEKYAAIDQQQIVYSSTPFISPPPKKTNINITPIIITPLPVSQEAENNLKPVVDMLRIIFNLPDFNATPSPLSDSSFSDQSDNALTARLPPINYTPPKTKYPYIYYPQCGGPFDNYPLGSSGCTLCYAGCGPTTVAMIVASYKDKSVDPRIIVNRYGSSVTCNGTGYTTAINVLRSYGINVGNLILYDNNGRKADQVVHNFANYINAGKTIFALANFRPNGGGHYFWIVDVDKDNNIWAFDPFYGRYQIPYNQNSRYPYPLYRVAFPVSP